MSRLNQFVITTLEQGLRPNSSHNTYVVCVNFIHEWQMTDFFEKLFMAILFILFARNLTSLVEDV